MLTLIIISTTPKQITTGVVQSSTGRILFFFDSHSYVCTNTFLRSAPANQTLVLTAGHCSYQYSPTSKDEGPFAKHGLFIPNRINTRVIPSPQHIIVIVCSKYCKAGDCQGVTGMSLLGRDVVGISGAVTARAWY